MKKLIFLPLVFILISCGNSDIPNADENYIKLNNLTPPSGSIINKPTEIKATVIYNIAQNELEQQGFEMTFWDTYIIDGKEDYWTGKRMAWTINKRSDSRDLSLEVFEKPPYDGKTYTISYKYSISRKSTDGNKYILIESEPVVYTINGKW